MRARLRALLPVAVFVMALIVAGCGGSSSTSSGVTGSAGPGTNVHIALPPVLRQLPMRNQLGQRVTLSSWPGRTVLLVPFLTLCQDICPMTTGNLLAVQQSLQADHAASKVQIVEISVDPDRDTSARLAAYARLTNASWQLVTESQAQLRAIAKFFGFSYQKVPEDNRAARDWWTGKPLSYDVDHSDNYFVIDSAGVERVVQDASPAFHGQLNPRLYKFLDTLGRQHLQQPAQPDWTPADVLGALAVVLHRPLPAQQLH